MPEKVILLPLPTKTCPAVIEPGVSVNPVKAVGIKVPSVAIGKFTSNLSVVSLNKIFASVALPLSITSPPEFKLIPAPASPLFILIILSLTLRSVVLTVVVVPVTVKLFIDTSFVKVLLPPIV